MKHVWLYRKGSPELLRGDYAEASVLTAGLTAVVVVRVPDPGCVCIYGCVWSRGGREVFPTSAAATGRTKKRYLHGEKECLLRS